ncbi:MAG TPA: phosphoribosylformylglycinamidine synthase, partial [Firmicutes bacterium]|nr:phosphoribosylformylglycinamidine synthase [Bacillota bacterium]
INAKTQQEAQKTLEEIARRVLSNPVIETFSCTLTEVQN